MIVRETTEFVVGDHDLKALLGLPKSASIKAVEVTDTAKYPDRVTGVRITALVRVRHREAGK